MPAEDPLAEVIAKAAEGRRVDKTLFDRQTAAVRAAGYKSPEEIAAALDAEEAKWRAPTKWPGRDARGGAWDAIGNLRAALLGTTEDSPS